MGKKRLYKKTWTRGKGLEKFQEGHPAEWKEKGRREGSCSITQEKNTL